MFLIVLFILILKLKPSISHFPEHTDFHKVGEIIFNNEKYKILKLTTHTVSDYFEHFMLGKEKPKPTKRLFVDDNAFRHQWSGFNKKTQSLRKTEIITDALDMVVKENISDKNDNSSVLPSNSESKENGTTAESSLNASIKDNNSSGSVENVTNNENSLEDPNAASTSKEDVSKINNFGEISPVNPEGVEEKTQTEEKQLSNTPEAPLRQRKPTVAPAKATKERTVVKTTFFCPFFGVITLSAFVD